MRAPRLRLFVAAALTLTAVAAFLLITFPSAARARGIAAESFEDRFQATLDSNVPWELRGSIQGTYMKYRDTSKGTDYVRFAGDTKPATDFYIPMRSIVGFSVRSGEAVLYVR